MNVEEAISRAHRAEWARLIAALTRRFGDLDVAEEATADAFLKAVVDWPRNGVPANPGGWLHTTAQRRAIDRLRREARRSDKYRQARMLLDDGPAESFGAIADDRLRLIFTCCHPALAPEARVALTLRMVGGLTVAEIARGFLIGESAMARRITRAKTKIAAAGIGFRVPQQRDLDVRMSGVLAVVFLIFNEGYLTGNGVDAVRVDLTDEALRLGRLLRALRPDDGEVAGLLALMLLTDARRAARVSPQGDLIVLADQDRDRWDSDLIAEGHALVRGCLSAVGAGGPPPGRYQLLAAVNAVHTHASSADRTDWAQIVTLYDRLLRLDPSPVVRLNRAVALAELAGPQTALAEIDRSAADLDGYHAHHAARADLLSRLGRRDEAVAAFDRSLALAENPAERAHLLRRRDALLAPGAE